MASTANLSTNVAFAERQDMAHTFVGRGLVVIEIIITRSTITEIGTSKMITEIYTIKRSRGVIMTKMTKRTKRRVNYEFGSAVRVLRWLNINLSV